MIQNHLDPEYMQTLSNAAASYIARQIPVLGVPGVYASGDDAKNPGYCHPTWGANGFTLTQLEAIPNWGGLAIVTGPNMVAIDNDTPEMATAFESAFVDLLNTYTEETAIRELPRYFFIPPYEVKLISRKAPGIELLANGRVAVVWPTQIDGRAYKIRNRVKARELTPDEWNRLQSFFDLLQSINGGQSITLDEDIPPKEASATAIVTYFDRLVELLGSRNQALTKAAFWAFNNRWKKADVTDALLDQFVQTAPVTRHKPEKMESRRAEGIRTINSVFKPGRKRLNNAGASTGEFSEGLPITARKLMLQLSEHTKNDPAVCPTSRHAARFLDITYFNGGRAGQVFTVEQATSLCKPFGMSRNPIQSLLNTTINGLRLFQKLENFQNKANALPENGAGAPSFSIVELKGKEGLCTKNNSNTTPVYNNVIYSDQNRAKPNQVGRPPSVYILPSIEYVCKVLGIDIGVSYSISASDLQSTKAYRSKFTEAFLERYPGKYSQYFLAKRAGVSRTTARRDIVTNPNINITPQYERKIIRFDNLEKLIPADESLLGWGIWLETGELDADGKPKRRHASIAIARKLLNQGLRVELVKQGKNYYETTNAVGELLGIAAGAEDTTYYRASGLRQKRPTKGLEAPNPSMPTQSPLEVGGIETDDLQMHGLSLGAVIGMESNQDE
jgi:hypothetical protein